MKKYISVALLFILIIGVGGCAQKIAAPKVKVVSTNIVEIKQVQSDNYMLFYQSYDGKKFYLLSVFEDNTTNNSIVNGIMNDMKDIINSREKNFEIVHRKYTMDEEWDETSDVWKTCLREVSLGLYGSYRNVIERGKLRWICLDAAHSKGLDEYFERTASAKIDNSTLLINSKVGFIKNFMKIWYRVKAIKFNKKIYLMLYRSNSYKDGVFDIYTNLSNLIRDSKIVTIKPPHKIDLIKFSKLL